MVIEKSMVASGKRPFEAVMMPVNNPDVLGTPEITPTLFIVTPSGSDPEDTAKTGGGVPEPAHP
jgi:hypothetical protein